MQMNRTRLIFFLIVGLAIVLVGGGVLLSSITGRPVNDLNPTATPKPDAQKTVQPQNIKSPPPLWGPNYKAGDGKPTYICGTDAFASYLTLMLIQQTGRDVANGFNLGIIPLQLTNKPEYALSAEQSNTLIEQGQWDCLLDTADSASVTGYGVVTAIVDESAGGDGMYAKGISTLNDLKGKRIAYVSDSSAEYFVHYILSVAQLNYKFDVKMLPYDTPDAAVKAFNEGKADAVSAWEPQLSRAKQSGGAPLITTSQLRLIVDTIATSKKAIAEKPNTVQLFHNAWFDALKFLAENPDAAGDAIVKWGYNDWSEVKTAADLRAQLKTIAQADLGANAVVMRDPTPLLNRMTIARRVWATAGTQASTERVEDLIDPRFVLAAAQNSKLQPAARLINDTFSIGAKLDLSGVSPNAGDASTLAVLPCRRFAFLPESATLTLESRRVLDDCVAPTLQQSVGLLLKVKGSSAWPGPKGSYTEAQILELAKARAQSVVDYLVSQKVDRARFIVEATLPPESHRETENADIQAEDRFVEMTLVTSGR